MYVTYPGESRHEVDVAGDPSPHPVIAETSKATDAPVMTCTEAETVAGVGSEYLA
jgi:hypothetical protein